MQSAGAHLFVFQNAVRFHLSREASSDPRPRRSQARGSTDPHPIFHALLTQPLSPRGVIGGTSLQQPQL